ncbi:MAG TPA: hypothetical protein VD789_10625, partial [Thermomicrobiales bacterium]|nr:hypothetical protein [Thermomicrobiales bacterium]
MRQHLLRAVAVIIAMAMMAPVLAPTASAESVTAWVEIGSKTPGVGCVVDVSIEVRSGGGALANADVAVALTEDGTSNVISVDRSTTNGS